MLLRALVLAAKKNSKEGETTPIDVLETIVVGRFDSDFSNGKTVISTQEADGSVSFSIPDQLSPAEVVALAMEAIAWLKAQPDPNNPNVYPRRIKRLRVSFAKAVTS